MKRALVLGCGGQGGSYLCEILLQRGYEVHGLYRHSSTGNLSRIEHLRNKITLHKGDVLDDSIWFVMHRVRPDEIYNMADQDNVDWSYAIPKYSLDVTVKGPSNVFECVKACNQNPRMKVFQPVSATMFGDASAPQNESTPLNPLSPYACYKAASYHLARYYRQAHGMHVSCGIMYNHDSTRRGNEYLLHKIAIGAIKVWKGKQECLSLYDLDAEVDIGSAPEYMNLVYRMMQDDNPMDMVIGTGRPYRVGTLAKNALMQLGFDPDIATGLVKEKPIPDRPGPTHRLIADGSKAKQLFGFVAKNDAMSVLTELVLHYKEKMR